MTEKLIGCILVIAGCGGFGFSLAATQLREERSLRELIRALEIMECELAYRLTPLPELCRLVCRQIGGSLGAVFEGLTNHLETQLAPDVDQCMRRVLEQTDKLPSETRRLLRRMGSSLGQYDASGQLQNLEAIHSECTTILEKRLDHQDLRLRSYRTLGLCAGAALAILLI